ncbi:MAG TPA: alpha/beta hydrolase, partial [Burkholderiaceae bacterium]|nr:alpha/beta hydrolase [Burkholderiaceae bacterium]
GPGEGVCNTGPAVLVGPADPERFGDADRLPRRPLELPCVMMASDTDPWLPAAAARSWAHRWGARFVNLGDAGHVDAATGFGPLPQVDAMIDELTLRLTRPRQNLERAAAAA